MPWHTGKYQLFINLQLTAEHKREHPLKALSTANALKAKLAIIRLGQASR
jgi:hypothetical protein